MSILTKNPPISINGCIIIGENVIAILISGNKIDKNTPKEELAHYPATNIRAKLKNPYQWLLPKPTAKYTILTFRNGKNTSAGRPANDFP